MDWIINALTIALGAVIGLVIYQVLNIFFYRNRSITVRGKDMTVDINWGNGPGHTSKESEEALDELVKQAQELKMGYEG